MQPIGCLLFEFRMVITFAPTSVNFDKRTYSLTSSPA